MKKEKQLLILFLTVIAGVFISCKDDEETSYSLSDLKMEFYLVNDDGEVSNVFKEKENFRGIFTLTNLTDKDFLLPYEAWNRSWEGMTYYVYSDDDPSLSWGADIWLIGSVGPWWLKAHQTKTNELSKWYYYDENGADFDAKRNEEHFLPAGNYHAELEVKNLKKGIKPITLTYSFKIVKPCKRLFRCTCNQ